VNLKGWLELRSGGKTVFTLMRDINDALIWCTYKVNRNKTSARLQGRLPLQSNDSGFLTRLPPTFMERWKRQIVSCASHETPHPNGLANAHSFRDTPATGLFAYTGKERAARRCIRAKAMTIGPRSSNVLGSGMTVDGAPAVP
jgi:hypothetical protein